MKATIRDAMALQTVGLADLYSYLRFGGWTELTEQARRGTSFWVHRLPTGDVAEIQLPREAAVRDYALRISEALNILEDVEQRSQLEIIRDLGLASADVIRVRQTTLPENGESIAIQDGLALVQHGRELMYSAAVAAVSPRRVIPPRRPQEAIEYMRKVRLGQTERGSFVLTIISPVSPLLTPPSGSAVEELDLPFSRAVTHTLGNALNAIQAAMFEAAATGRFDAFEAAIAAGVSANLCESIAGMSGADEGRHEISVDIAWAPSRPTVPDTFRRVRFSVDAIEIVREAARLFRETGTVEGVPVLGVVVNLSRPPGEADGVATVMGSIEGKLRRVLITLTGSAYELAIDAHRTQRPLAFEADIAREGRTFRGLNVHDLHVLSDT